MGREIQYLPSFNLHLNGRCEKYSTLVLSFPFSLQHTLKISTVSIFANTLHNLHITYKNHFKKKRLQVFFLSIEKISNFSRFKGTPDLYYLHRQISHSSHSPSYQTDGTVRRYLHIITLSHILKYEESTRKLFDSHITQISYEGVSLQLFRNNS